MANTKQAQKMIRITERRTGYNKSWKSKVKSKVKILEAALKNKEINKEDLQSKYIQFQKIIDKTVSKGIYHKNKANRIKTRMVKKIIKSELEDKTASNKNRKEVQASKTVSTSTK